MKPEVMREIIDGSPYREHEWVRDSLAWKCTRYGRKVRGHRSKIPNASDAAAAGVNPDCYLEITREIMGS